MKAIGCSQVTHSFPMHSFSDVFRGYRKGALGTNVLKSVYSAIK